eukprot:5017558-Prymnesium_polylepis.1
MATYLGVESPLVRGRVGEHIPDGPTRHRVCDAYGIQLALATLPGRSFDDHHDDILGTIYRDLRRMVEIYCGVDGQDEPRHLFAGVLPVHAIRQVGARRLGIIPDMRLCGVCLSLTNPTSPPARSAISST